jgi:hypothetical protein
VNWNVSKRFFVTLPDAIGDALDRWAAAERNKPATLAAFLLEQVIRQAIDDGKVPPEPDPSHLTYDSLAQLIEQNWERLIGYGRIPETRLRELQGLNQENLLGNLSELELARLALALDLEESYIESLLPKS